MPLLDWDDSDGIIPLVSLTASDAICTDQFLLDPVLVDAFVLLQIVIGILVPLGGQQTFGALVTRCSEPIGLAYHPKTVGREVLIGERGIYSRHRGISSLSHGVHPHQMHHE